ncbi:hypothetical protein [Nonomuraea gerenzanensis]|uniref:Integral membrane protein n=1 Tax=Nonomuraea gerenzanensis TaxID=93944 RepID=A0A1M4DXD4_9ACTN|nr:hypothetical protein [Nonomuraea gerenzanensis]UBU13556.1 hypothetical protein LCN96_00515 [Nonomuraea gerenzanensis]SBO91221.1 hypothetical protein BN4615_P735 [Nonomuraea gerenzanensis]
MGAEQVSGSTGRTVRLVILVIAGIVVANVLVSLLMARDTGLGVDELIAFGGGAALGLLVEFAGFRRSGR